jgi:TRAP-type C4-dicarboxylate transport system permease small subunit
VLSLSLVSGLMALSMAVSLFINIVPFFGITLTGIPAMIYEVTFGAVAAWSAWRLYHQRMQGWLAIVGLSVLGMLSWVVTLLRGNMLEMYRAYGMPREQLQQMTAITELHHSPAYWLAIIASALVWAGYLWFARKALLAVRSAA